jgi:uncharacterized protein (DUF2345 family)
MSGLVFVTLDAPHLPERTADGVVSFRGTAAVVLQGPATVRLVAGLSTRFRASAMVDAAISKDTPVPSNSAWAWPRDAASAPLNVRA